ncbi:MAG: hypothetical protein IPJ13_14360 [Saprospiraceae bacterium]|nr:hypothetical protein [Saprospiraceae bacterium]
MKLFSDELIDEIYAKSKIIDVPAGTQILRLGQYIKVPLPIVLSGKGQKVELWGRKGISALLYQGERKLYHVIFGHC